MTLDVTTDGPKQINNLTLEPLLNVEELATALNVPKSWVYSRTRETGPGSMPSLSVGKYKRFQLPDVMAWIEKQNQSD